MDPRPLNFLLTPENGYPVLPYTAEYASPNGTKDGYLLQLMEDIEHMRTLDDVRPYLDENFKVRQILKNSKLI